MGLRILLVEDDPNIRMIAKTSLTFGHDFEVDEAEDGEKALEILRQSPDKYDLVLMDVMMPNVDGLEALTQIKNDPNLKHIPVVMLTAMAQKADIEKSISLGADGYIEKPFDPVELPKTVMSIYRRIQSERANG